MQSKKIKILRDSLGSFYKSTSELLFSCPKCKHPKKKLSINVDKNVFKCWICEYSGKDVSSLLRYYGESGSANKWRELTGKVEITAFDDLFSTDKRGAEQKKISLELPKGFRFLGKDNGDLDIAPINYLKSRGLGLDDVYKWRIGYCSEGVHAGRIIIPSFDSSGELTYYIARSYGDQWPKYMNPKCNKDVVFNELNIDWDEDVVLVEGAFDAIKASNAIPLLGSTLRETSFIFKSIVDNKKEIYLALDPDAKQKALKIAKKFLQYGLSVYMIDVRGYEDVGSMSKVEFEKFKREASFIEDEYYLLYESIGL